MVDDRISLCKTDRISGLGRRFFNVVPTKTGVSLDFQFCNPLIQYNYPLVNVYITVENLHVFMAQSTNFLWAMFKRCKSKLLNYQGGSTCRYGGFLSHRGTPKSSKSSSFNGIFHYKSSSYGGTHIYGNPQICPLIYT